MPASIILLLFALACDFCFINARISPPSTSVAPLPPPLTMRQLLLLVEVRLGSRKVSAHLMLDTGSSLIWWQCFPCQCFPCRTCYKQNDPRFLPSKSASASYSDISCSSPLCQECINNEQNCGYQVGYGDGDQSSGKLGPDELSTVDGSVVQKKITFGCAGSGTGNHFDGEYTGILGFGSSYSFCFVSESFLHGDPPPTVNGPAITVSLLVNYHNIIPYYVPFSGIKIGKQTLIIGLEKWNIDEKGNYGVMLDSGAVISRFPRDMYVIFRDTFREEFGEYESFRVKVEPDALLDTCYDVYEDEEDIFYGLPDVKLYFGTIREQNNLLLLDWKQVMVELFRNITHVRYCLAFAVDPSEEHHTPILGTHQLQGTRLSYDTNKMTLTLDPDEC